MTASKPMLPVRTGLSWMDQRVLDAIRAQPRTVRELAPALETAEESVSRSIARLLERKLVESGGDQAELLWSVT